LYICSRKKQKVENSTDKKILFTAEKLFAQKGFDATSTRDIAGAAQVNVSMISYYFGSKEKLFEEIFKVRMTEGLSFATEIIENNEMNEWQKFTKIIENYVKRVKTLPEFYSILQSVYNSGNQQILNFLKTSKMGFLKIFQNLLEDGFGKGIFTKKPDLFFMHSVVIGTVFYAKQSMTLYEELSESDKGVFLENYYDNLTKHLTTLLKDLLGYEEKN
jgi:AcrR family transcriptional regulator